MVQGSSVTYRCGEFHIDAANRRFTRGGTEIDLEPKVFAVVLQLLAQPGSLVARNDLLDAVWGHR
jgi:DNA-binding winged helix-turn-helix (wHTH) protein